MPQLEVTARVPLDPTEAFSLALETGEARAAWDPSVAASRWLRGATGPVVGGTLFTRSPRGRRRLLRVEHLTPDRLVALRLVRGDRLLADYGEGVRVEPEPGGSRVTWKVTFKVRAPLAARAIGELALPRFERELEARMAGFVAAAAARAGEAGQSSPPGVRPAQAAGR